MYLLPIYRRLQDKENYSVRNKIKSFYEIFFETGNVRLVKFVIEILEINFIIHILVG